MRNIITASALVILLAVPQLAAAAALDSLESSADCEGWQAQVTIVFRPGAMMAHVEHVVVLHDPDGVEVERFASSRTIGHPGTDTAVLTYWEEWSVVPDGDFTVTGTFTVFDLLAMGETTTSESFTAVLPCGADEEQPGADVCAYTARHWYENPDAWPVTELEIGGRVMDQDALLTALAMQGNRFLKLALIREVAAAKLNLANGVSGHVADLLVEADALLAELPSSRRESARRHGDAMRLRAALFQFNRGDCPDAADGVTMALDEGAYAGAEWDKAAVEVMSLGSVKALYR